jgi:carnitine O-acetyltransferase
LNRLFYEASKESIESPALVPVGLITAGHRDTCYEGYSLLSKTPINAESLKLIKKSQFIVCLDAHSCSKNLDISHHQIFHNFNAENRWFDKAIQLVVASNGRAGVNGEHTPADAVIPGRMMDFIVSKEAAPIDDSRASPSRMPEPKALQWQIGSSVKQVLAKAQQEARKLIADTESCLLQTDVYGSRFIKEVGRLVLLRSIGKHWSLIYMRKKL